MPSGKIEKDEAAGTNTLYPGTDKPYRDIIR
ncbi:hypothetical protein NIASO_10570 [Niabella soli DSM 19437]|uniref:Uncharacterized protein n=1 Tax=Niabella soli DSM 19437 TaxID=929713 RepID=W0F3H8_9BACT|nr:hypothetical protein NIASO_10570 [Niabella soli DSM 19437]